VRSLSAHLAEAEERDTILASMPHRDECSPMAAPAAPVVAPQPKPRALEVTAGRVIAVSLVCS
jgi:hypothetical protein